MTGPRDRLATLLADHYRIERELGAGGMATVYLAHDLKHDRKVAIKVLKPELAASITGERFLREIAITARLNHPHILALLDSGAVGEGQVLYYVMPVAAGESLRDRLSRTGPMSAADALHIASDVTEALVHAHAQGVVHRDIKPENVLLSSDHAIVVDFGIAKAIGHAREGATLTSEGTSLGTPAYMAPEQASGDDQIDHRADVYAVGAILFEMIAGSPPFSGSWQQVVIEKLGKDAPSLASRSASVSREIERLVARCLARDPANRPASAEQLLRELRSIASPVSAGGSSRRPTRVIAGVAIAAIVVLGVLYARDRRARWVHETALPTVRRLVDADELDSAFALAQEAAARAPNDAAARAAFASVSLPQTFMSEPAGALVTRAALKDTAHWIRVGTTPTPAVRIPTNAWFYRYTLAGYRSVTLMGARLGGSYVPIPSPVALRKLSDPDTDMVLIRGTRLTGTLYGLAANDTFNLADLLMDKLEVTNRQYKAFVDAGGYSKRDWWDSTFVRGGKPLEWKAASALFVDKTGRAGPSSWEGGAPQSGSEDLPLGGVSWYEARAYARFAGKALPTVVEWNAAAMPEAARWVVPQGRYESNGPVAGGAAKGVSPRGVYDMAGNVREWTANARETGSRYILGGGWSDPPYLFNEIYTQPEFDRSAINGIRLVKRLGDARDLTRASAPIFSVARDFNATRPVDDVSFRGLLAFYDYDRTPLNAKIVSRDSTNADWEREDVEFDVPGSPLRMVAVIFLPRRVTPPYQTVVMWPASDAFILRDRATMSMAYADFYLRSGRAVVYPIYEHTYGRGTTSQGDVASVSIEHRDQMLRWVREMRRSIDYAVARPDIDSSRIAYAGTSWGGRIAGVALAIEPRFRAAVLNVAGIGAPARRPEEDPVNFLPRIRIPVLMLNGRYDSVFPYETAQKPFLKLLGTPADKKKQILFDGGHFLPRPMMMAESLKWLDQYLGPVVRQ